MFMLYSVYEALDFRANRVPFSFLGGQLGKFDSANYLLVRAGV